MIVCTKPLLNCERCSSLAEACSFRSSWEASESALQSIFSQSSSSTSLNRLLSFLRILHDFTRSVFAGVGSTIYLAALVGSRKARASVLASCYQRRRISHPAIKKEEAATCSSFQDTA